MMKKMALLLATASVASVPAVSYAIGPIDGTVYGKVNISVVNDDNGTDDQMELNSNASRVGLKGKTKITENTYAIFKAEYESFWDDGEKGSGDTFSQRNIIGGFTGPWGTIWGGKHDTPTKLAQKKVDLFNDLEGDIKNVMVGETRASNIVNYTTPTVAGFSASVATVFGEDRSDNDKDGAFDSYSAVAQYDNNGIYVAVAVDENVESGSSGQGIGKDYVDILRVVGQFDIGPVQLGALWQNAEEGDSSTLKALGGELDEDSWHASVKVKLGNGYTAKAQYTESEDDETDVDADLVSFGVDKKVGQNTKVFAFWTQLDESTASDKEDWVGFGMEHKF
ncbi:MAG TPA: porin [Porticoccaceae bacterium]|nr:porin [Porticoccaceae bacterium]